MEKILNPKAMLGYPIHHLLQVGSVSFLQKGLCWEDMCAQHYVVRWNLDTICARHVMLFSSPLEILFSDCRVAVVTFRTFVVRSCRALPQCNYESLPFVMPFMAAAKRFGEFGWDFFLSVRMSWLYFALYSLTFFFLVNRWLQWRDTNLLNSNLYT